MEWFGRKSVQRMGLIPRARSVFFAVPMTVLWGHVKCCPLSSSFLMIFNTPPHLAYPTYGGFLYRVNRARMSLYSQSLGPRFPSCDKATDLYWSILFRILRKWRLSNRDRASPVDCTTFGYTICCAGGLGPDGDDPSWSVAGLCHDIVIYMKPPLLTTLGGGIL